MAYANKSFSFIIVFLLILSVITLPCIESCGTCVPTHKPPPPPPTSSITPCPPPPHAQSCPRDVLKLGVCADLLGLAHVVVGKPPSESKCCALLNGLADLEAAVCLCTAIKANVLGVKLDMPVALGVLISACRKTLPSGYTCK